MLLATGARRRTAITATALASVALALGLPAAPALAATQTYASSAGITINQWGTANPYPSTITVGGPASVISDVDVTLSGFAHEYMADVDILLVGPGGQSVVLMSDAGCSANVSGLNLTFDQSAASTVPSNDPPVSGTYRPTNVTGGCDDGSEEFPAPAPSEPWGDSLDVFNGTDAVGTWNLFVMDDLGIFGGSIAEWSLSIDADPVVAPQITSAASGDAAVGTPFTHTFTATGFPTPTLSYSAVDLPDGVTRTGDTISGTPTQTGDFSITVTASNGGVPDAVQVFELEVEATPAAPVIALAAGQAAVTNAQPIKFTITFDDAPVGFDETDVAVTGSAGGGVLTLEGGPLEWTASVTGLTGDGSVELSIPEGRWTNAAGFLGAAAGGPSVTLDTVVPVMTGPLAPIETTTDPGRPDAVVTFDVTAAGGDPAPVCVPVSGSAFPIGTTAVECTGTDVAGNSSVLGFDVTVVDDEAPVIDAVEDVSIELADGETSTPVTITVPAATDNSGTVHVTCDLAPGTELGVGTRAVTCSAEDPSGNTATSAFDVVVVAPADDGTDDDGTDDGTDDDGTDDDGTDDDGTEDDESDAPEDDELSDTGTDLRGLLVTAMLLVGAGVALVVTTSQRRRLTD